MTRWSLKVTGARYRALTHELPNGVAVMVTVPRFLRPNLVVEVEVETTCGHFSWRPTMSEVDTMTPTKDDEIEALRAERDALRSGLARAIEAADIYANWGGAKEYADELDDLRELLGEADDE